MQLSSPNQTSRSYYYKNDFEKGQAYFEALALKGAIECFERSIAARRKVSASYEMIAKCYQKLGKLKEVFKYSELAQEAGKAEALAARSGF